MRPTRDDLARFFAKVHVVRLTGCWLWIAACGRSGYGSFGCGHGRTDGAHVVSYRWFVGDIPADWEVDHLCRHPKCVNPAHLEAVTQIENMRRYFRLRTHCSRGHEFTPETTRVWSSGVGKRSRYCLICRRENREASKKALRRTA